tara:strand:+ start:30 stop:320 length:291 start_codon:yes stop_codon:yes gene_type:complete
MSPDKQYKLNKIRRKLDNLDDALIKLVKRRTNLVNEVLKLKSKKNQIVDKKRIKIILKRIKIKSKKNKIDPKITNRIWKNMIWSYIDYEKRNFKKK